MAQSCGNAFAALIVEGHHAAVAQGQLQLSLALLACNLARHTSVDLVGEPVLAGHGLELEDTLEAGFYSVYSFYSSYRVFHWGVVAFYGLVAHDGFRRVAEHLCHIEVERLLTVGLHKREVCITSGLADYVHRSTLALSDTAYEV